MTLTFGAYLSFWLRYAHFSLIFRPIFIFMAFPVVIFKHFFYLCTFSQNFNTHHIKTSVIHYSICFRKVVKIFQWVQSLQSQAYWDHFHRILVKFQNGFSQVFVSNVVPKTNTKVQHGCGWGVAVEISTKKAKIKKLVENNHLYECVRFYEFGRQIFTWSWISIYGPYFSLV